MTGRPIFSEKRIDRVQVRRCGCCSIVGQETSAGFGGNFNVVFIKRLAFITDPSLVTRGFKLKAYLAALNYLFMDARGSVQIGIDPEPGVVRLSLSLAMDAMEFAVAGRTP